MVDASYRSFFTQRMPKVRQVGFTLVELMLAVTIIGILASVAITSYADYIERMRVERAKVEIVAISVRIDQYYTDAHSYPRSLIDLGGAPIDPWGRAYVYADLTANGNGVARRDRSLNPLNSDYDLYSVGKDGVTKKPISQKDSLDDVLRANDGRFVDLASKF